MSFMISLSLFRKLNDQYNWISGLISSSIVCFYVSVSDPLRMKSWGIKEAINSMFGVFVGQAFHYINRLNMLQKICYYGTFDEKNHCEKYPLSNQSIKQIDIQMFNVPRFCNMFLASMQERGKTEEGNVYRIEPCHG